jgi:hypothetical protein
MTIGTPTEPVARKLVRNLPPRAFSLMVDLEGHNKNRFPKISAPPIALW